MPRIVRPKPDIRNLPNAQNLDREMLKSVKPKNEGEGYLLKIYPADPTNQEIRKRMFPTTEARDRSIDWYKSRGVKTRRG